MKRSVRRKSSQGLLFSNRLGWRKVVPNAMSRNCNICTPKIGWTLSYSGLGGVSPQLLLGLSTGELDSPAFERGRATNRNVTRSSGEQVPAGGSRTAWNRDKMTGRRHNHEGNSGDDGEVGPGPYWKRMHCDWRFLGKMPSSCRSRDRDIAVFERRTCRRFPRGPPVSLRSLIELVQLHPLLSPLSKSNLNTPRGTV